MAKKVLVVDDEKLIVKGIRFSLEQDGMEVDCAYDGEEALSMAKEKEYDMILLDLMLPKLDGLSVCQQIREFSNVPIVMLTAKGEDMDKILGLEYGADDYIIKAALPVDFSFEKTTLNLELADGAVVSDKSNCLLNDLGGRPVVNLTVENASLVIANDGETRTYQFQLDIQ